jgi:hypothetical protein
MRCGAVLLAFGAGGGPDPLSSALVSETALNHRNTVQFPKYSKFTRVRNIKFLKQPRSASVNPATERAHMRKKSAHAKGAHMRKIGLTLAAVAAIATTAVVNSPAEARGGRNAAIGFGVAAGVLGAAAAANAYNNGYYYGPRYGYYEGGPYGYYDGGPRYYRRHYRYYDGW